MKQPLIRLGIAVFLLTGIISTGAASSRSAAAFQDDAAVAKQFLGMWRLVGWTQRSADGTVRPGQIDIGYLVYTDVNRMCAVMMDSKRPKWTPGAPATVPDAVARSAGFVSYCARVEINAKEGFVLHHVDVERSPNIVGTIRKRWFTFEGPNRLVLKVDAAELGTQLESRLVWERVQN
jgi:lipocalin-like protein